jgi:hypothetical protein
LLHLHRRRGLLAAAASIVAVSGATTAQAATVTVTGDDGNPVGIAQGTPTSIRNMAPNVQLAFPPAAARYSSAITGPDGTSVSSPQSCYTTSPSTRYIDFRGNGNYTVTITNFAAGVAVADRAAAGAADPAARRCAAATRAGALAAGAELGAANLIAAVGVLVEVGREVGQRVGELLGRVGLVERAVGAVLGDGGGVGERREGEREDEGDGGEQAEAHGATRASGMTVVKLESLLGGHVSDPFHGSRRGSPVLRRSRRPTR